METSGDYLGRKVFPSSSPAAQKLIELALAMELKKKISLAGVLAKESLHVYKNNMAENL